MLDQLVEIDKELFIYLNSLGTETWDSFWMFYTTKFNWIPFYAILVYLMYRKLNTKMFILTLVVVALMITFTDQVSNLFKNVFVRRPRPCHNDEVFSVMRLVKSYCGGKFGYFSGHASNSMAVAIFTGFMLKEKYKYLIYFMIIWAAAMGYSRIYIGVHYPLDVLSGALFGALSGYIFYRLDKYIQSKFQLK
ncbi:phosphatase PAP2 family protein [Flaviramulus sp. BrNp1-15]|uniref:phosphatase PAP2 family protein n=1 Tax=Flaviramulus sp. BrNp1-15 TaxID=2916754 RepID=UPI001EE8D72F|nr:phosphatase PAP2 family protein [Flaviramulus sp. BrNp1-15]ULC58547.1 phosphatase PAP2 family protein [Flaviramulus sp. BrNp1-15]